VGNAVADVRPSQAQLRRSNLADCAAFGKGRLRRCDLHHHGTCWGFRRESNAAQGVRDAGSHVPRAALVRCCHFALRGGAEAGARQRGSAVVFGCTAADVPSSRLGANPRACAMQARPTCTWLCRRTPSSGTAASCARWVTSTCTASASAALSAARWWQLMRAPRRKLKNNHETQYNMARLCLAGATLRRRCSGLSPADRAYHYLGLNHMAVPMYEKVLLR
jgi:hypothetical protein